MSAVLYLVYISFLHLATTHLKQVLILQKMSVLTTLVTQANTYTVRDWWSLWTWRWICDHYELITSWFIIGLGNGLVPAWHQAITSTNDDLLCTEHFETNFSEIWINPQKISSKKMHLKTLSEKWRSFFRPQCDESGKAMGQNQTDVTLYLVPWGNRIKACISNYIHIK